MEAEKRERARETRMYIVILIASFAVGMFLRSFIFFVAIVPTDSMVPTINANDQLIGSRIVYLFSDVKRGDVIVFDFPDSPNQLYVKRAIGLPGDTIEIKEGVVYINDEMYNESGFMEEPTGNFDKITVPKDCYFVLGDNRNNSYDSRYWKTTNFVSKDAILGKVLIRTSPKFSKIE